MSKSIFRATSNAWHLLLQQVMTSGVIIYELGGWQAPWGIEYRIDTLNAFVLLIITTISTLVLFAAQTRIEKDASYASHAKSYAA